jgi:rhodanese-related sulfurtransferase
MTARISARDAWQALEADPHAVLIDVRTPQEWAGLGIPDLSEVGREALTITWDPYAPDRFAQALRQAVPDVETPVYFLCRSGARSQMTADLAESLGYGKSVNVVEGYEGPPGANGQRGTVCGWQASKLPIKAWEGAKGA